MNIHSISLGDRLLVEGVDFEWVDEHTFRVLNGAIQSNVTTVTFDVAFVSPRIAELKGQPGIPVGKKKAQWKTERNRFKRR